MRIRQGQSPGFTPSRCHFPELHPHVLDRPLFLSRCSGSLFRPLPRRQDSRSSLMTHSPIMVFACWSNSQRASLLIRVPSRFSLRVRASNVMLISFFTHLFLELSQIPYALFPTVGTSYEWAFFVPPYCCPSVSDQCLSVVFEILSY